MTYEERKQQAAEIEARKERGEPITAYEQKLLNLSKAMIQEGEVRNPEGRKKGCHNWSTHFQKLMGDEAFLKTIITSTPQQWDGVVDDMPASVIAAGLIATVTRQVAQAVADGKPLDKNTLKAIDTLNKIGFGEQKNISLDNEQGFFEKPVINFIVKSPRQEEPES